MNLKTVDPLKFLREPYLRFSASRHPFIRLFKPRVKIDFSRGNYRVKTVDCGAELEEVLALRYEIFHREFGGKRFPMGIDIEHYDELADHLIIQDTKTNRIVGTYRLICSLFSNTFYSASEFHLESFLSAPGVKLELSRAGVEKGYRNGVVMTLLWRGVSEYLSEVEASYLFGCGSVKTTALADARLICGYLAQNGFLDDTGIRTTEGYKMSGFNPDWANGEKVGTELPGGDAKAMIPPLLQAYLKMGAKLSPEPALDRDFNCIDFLTILKVEALKRPFERKYRRC